MPSEATAQKIAEKSNANGFTGNLTAVSEAGRIARDTIKNIEKKQG